MLKIKYLIRSLPLLAVMGMLFGLLGCLEKDEIPNGTGNSLTTPAEPFGLYKIHLTLIDADTKASLPNLLVKLSNNTSFQMSSSEVTEQITDSTGVVHITIAATPPIPQEFIFSLTDTTLMRYFQQTSISIRFIDPVFIYIPKDAARWGKLYQGTAELTLIHELKQI